MSAARLVDEFDHIVPGQRYRVTFTDCCVEGSFVGNFVGWHPSSDYTVEHDRAEFNVGGNDPLLIGGAAVVCERVL